MTAESLTDHNHEQVAHDIERYVTRITDTSASPESGTVHGVTAGIRIPK